jgi:transcriptional regulator with XRE-family HTH domain
MSFTQHIRKYRQQKKFTQKHLAELVKTEHHRIQLLEAGIAPIRPDLAKRISDALGQPLRIVFPAIHRVLKKFPGDKLASEDAREEAATAGLEVDHDIWRVNLGMRSGALLQFTISSAQMYALRECYDNWVTFCPGQGEIPYFFQFDSYHSRISINLTEVVHSQFFFDRPPLVKFNSEGWEGDGPNVSVWMNNALEPLGYRAAMDVVSENKAEGQPEFGRLMKMLEEMDENMENGSFATFMDENGEFVYLHIEDVSVIAVAHWLLNPDMLGGEDEEDPFGEESEQRDLRTNDSAFIQ